LLTVGLMTVITLDSDEKMAALSGWILTITRVHNDSLPSRHILK